MTMEQLEYFMVMLFLPKAMELSHYKKEAQMVIVNLVFLPTQSDLFEQALFSMTDINNSHRDSIVADLESFSIRCPVYNVERNEYN